MKIKNALPGTADDSPWQPGMPTYLIALLVLGILTAFEPFALLIVIPIFVVLFVLNFSRSRGVR
jgi:hypothetical protein